MQRTSTYDLGVDHNAEDQYSSQSGMPMGKGKRVVDFRQQQRDLLVSATFGFVCAYNSNWVLKTPKVSALVVPKLRKNAASFLKKAGPKEIQWLVSKQISLINLAVGASSCLFWLFFIQKPANQQREKRNENREVSREFQQTLDIRAAQDLERRLANQLHREENKAAKLQESRTSKQKETTTYEALRFRARLDRVREGLGPRSVVLQKPRVQPQREEEPSSLNSIFSNSKSSSSYEESPSVPKDLPKRQSAVPSENTKWPEAVKEGFKVRNKYGDEIATSWRLSD